MQEQGAGGAEVEIVVRVPRAHVRALRSAIHEFSAYLANRSEELHAHHEERALTEGIAALGRVRAAVFAACPQPHPSWPGRN